VAPPRGGEKYERVPFIIINFKKTYQFIDAVNGVSRTHKTANIFFSFDSVA